MEDDYEMFSFVNSAALVVLLLVVSCSHIHDDSLVRLAFSQRPQCPPLALQVGGILSQKLSFILMTTYTSLVHLPRFVFSIVTTGMIWRAYCLSFLTHSSLLSASITAAFCNGHRSLSVEPFYTLSSSM
ncbi:hypothetical protein DPSP01_006606 [Paraphaeosphaeria sporulosa]